MQTSREKCLLWYSAENISTHISSADAFSSNPIGKHSRLFIARSWQQHYLDYSACYCDCSHTTLNRGITPGKEMALAGTMSRQPCLDKEQIELDVQITPLSTTRLSSCYLSTHDTPTPPQSSDIHPDVRQEHTEGAVFIQQETVYHPVIIIYNHISYQPAM